MELKSNTHIRFSCNCSNNVWEKVDSWIGVTMTLNIEGELHLFHENGEREDVMIQNSI